MRFLRVATIGAVDDGKSTLLGRLLHDSDQLLDDQLAALEEASRRRGLDHLDLSFVTDGLRAEREQGITIDVAYRYVTLPDLRLVIADCPGHVQYTANMATGASTADVVAMVVDVTTGLRQQTRRHLAIAAVLGVRSVILAVNKMDLVSWSEERFRAVANEVEMLGARLGVESTVAVPTSALLGDYVVEPSGIAPWYNGPTLLEALRSSRARSESGPSAARFPVQWVLRHPDGSRAYAGHLSQGQLRPGDELVVLPSGLRTRVIAIETFDGPLDVAVAPLAVSLRLEGDLDIGRGDLLAHPVDAPVVSRHIEAVVCWFADRPLVAGTTFRLKHTTRTTRARVDEVVGRLDLDELDQVPSVALDANDLGLVRLTVADPLAIDPYRQSREMGSFLLLDESTLATAGAGMAGLPAWARRADGVEAGEGPDPLEASA